MQWRVFPIRRGITRTSGAKAKPPVFDHPSGGDGGAGREVDVTAITKEP